MKWELKEEEILVKFYLKHVNDWKNNIDELMIELTKNGFENREKNSARMRVSNVAYLHTGNGLSNASKQTKEVYNRLK